MWDRGHRCFVFSVFAPLLFRGRPARRSCCGSPACRAGSSAQIYPRGPETVEPAVDEKCLSCQLWFPAWPLLLDRPSRPRRAPTPGPLCVDPAPCGLAALWPFTCDCVQSPCSPPSEPRASVPISCQLPTLRERERFISALKKSNHL